MRFKSVNILQNTTEEIEQVLLNQDKNDHNKTININRLTKYYILPDENKKYIHGEFIFYPCF